MTAGRGVYEAGPDPSKPPFDFRLKLSVSKIQVNLANHSSELRNWNLAWAFCRMKGRLWFQVQGLLQIKDTHRPYGGPMLLGIALP